MDYRVEQLAAAGRVSVDTVRYYQAKGLLPPPRHEGRVAIYDEAHLTRLRRIRSLQKKGLTLAVIGRVLEGTIARADEDLAAAVAAARAEGEDEEFLTANELADRSGVPLPLIQAVEAEGIVLSRPVDGGRRYTTADVQMVRHALTLLEAGIPLGELLALARAHHDSAREVAERAVRLFDEYVRTPIRGAGLPEEEAAERLVTAFRELLPAVTDLVAHHFRRVLLATADEHIERVGDESEIAATRAESRRRLEGAWRE